MAERSKMDLTPIFRFTASMPDYPDAGLFVAFWLRWFVAGSLHVLVRLAPVAVVGLVVEDDDVLLLLSSRRIRRTIWAGVSVNAVGVVGPSTRIAP